MKTIKKNPGSQSLSDLNVQFKNALERDQLLKIKGGVRRGRRSSSVNYSW